MTLLDWLQFNRVMVNLSQLRWIAISTVSTVSTWLIAAPNYALSCDNDIQTIDEKDIMLIYLQGPFTQMAMGLSFLVFLISLLLLAFKRTKTIRTVCVFALLFSLALFSIRSVVGTFFLDPPIKVLGGQEG